MRRLGFILLTGICLLVFVVPIRSQEISDIYTDSLTMDSIAIDSLDPDPEWYVAPLVRETDFAPRRAAAANCPVDSVLTFNVDSVLVEVTMYEYGDTTRTMVWTVNADGSRVGKSRTESASTATTSYSATYAWDANSNNWKGTSKEEHTYNSANKETLRVLYNTWLNNEWVADTKYTWAYDAAGRESEYTTYTRNTTTNELVLSKQRIREYNVAGKTTLDIQYTAHNGSAWSAGTKKEYDYDAAGNQIEYTYYSSLSNGNWVGSTHEKWTYTSGKKTYYEKQTWSNGGWSNSTKEIWAYNGPSAKQTLYEKYTGSGSTWTGSSKEIWEYTTSGKQTLHEKYSWSSSDWSLTLQENSGYDAAGNNNLVENYNVSNGTFTGTKKEEYTFKGTKKTVVIKYKWSNGAFIYNTKAVTDVDDAGNSIETANYTWTNNDWKGTGTRTLQTFNSSKKVTKKITQTWPTGSADWVNKTCTTTVYSGANMMQELYSNWSNDAWVASKRTDYHYNASNKNDTTTSYTYSDDEWKYANRTVNTFNANGTNIMTHNAKWQDNAWVMTSMTRMDISDMTVDGIRQTLNAQWQCGADSVWKGVQKDTSSYTSSGKKIMEAHYTSWANNAWVPSYIIEHEYDAADREILNRRMDWVNNKWQGHYLFEYEYDDQDRQIAYTYYGDWNNSTNSWIGSSKYDYVYGPNGKYSQQVMYKWQNNQWVGMFQYFYTYDASDREVEQLVQSYSNGNWENSQLYIHEYDITQLLKNNEYRWRNGQWQYSRRNEKTYDKDIQAKLRREIIGSWNTNGVLSSFTDKLYSYACDPRTIRFVNYDGTLLETQIVEKGVTPSYSGVAPTREGNAEYTYTFAGWAPELVPVTNNATYTATYTATKNTYTITWVDDFGNEIDQTTAEYGTMPTHDNVSKANTAEFSYEFTGWTPGLGVVTGDAEYTATFKATKNSYTVTWLNSDNSLLSQSTVEYGVTPTSPSDPTKASTAEYSYTFTGWSPAITAVTGETTYTATFTQSKRKYTVTWLNEDGSILEQEELEFGTTPAHADIYKESTAEYTYTFTGWTPQIVPVAGDAEYTATFTATKNKYTVTFKDEDGTTLKSEELEYGVTPTAPADPTKAATGGYLYTFSGWTPEIVSVTSEATYTATFTATKNSYTITWLNEDGSEIEHETLEYGATPVHADMTKENTAEYTYAFTGWTPAIVDVVGNASYQATFSATKNSYTITWLNEDGSEIEHETLEYGATPSHADVTKESTAEYTYAFAGWTPQIVTVTGDASYTASFTATKNKYTIIFLNYDGTELQSSEVEYGIIPNYEGATPIKPADAQDTYTFAGWDQEIIPVAGTKTYTATFNATKNSYTITWKNDDGSVIESETLTYGTTPAHANIYKESTAEWTYTFAGWTPAIASVTGDAVYTATFTATKNKYLITFKNEDGTTLKSEELEYGATPVAPANPTKAATAEWTYTFAGWDKEIISVAEATTYTATYTATKNSYTITWLNEDGSKIEHETLEYGATPQHADVTKENTAEFTYTFTGWTPAIVSITGDASYTAMFSATKNKYTITWLDDDNSSLGTTYVEYGVVPTHENPTKQPTAQYGYTFAGWSPAITSVTGNATYKATYTDTINQYTISWLDDIGTLVDQTKVAYGSTPAHANIYKESDDQYDYTFVGWTPTLVPVTGDASYSAIFTTAGKSYTVTFYFEDGVTILDQMTLPYGAIPSTPYIPSIPSDANHTYTFSGWSPEIAPVTGDISYVPTFTAIPNQYTVIFRNYNGKELQRKKVDYGTIPAYEGDEPSRPATNSYTWAFEGWTPELTAVIGDATYTAVYIKVMNTYTILFYDEDDITLLDEVTVEHGQKPTTSVIPTKEADEEYRYTFAGWSPKIAKATADAEYTATYMATPKTQDLSNTEAEGAAIKVIIEDKIFIRRGGNTYSIDGQRVK